MRNSKAFYLFFLILMLFSFGCAHTQLQQNDKKFSSGDNLDNWMKRYYKSPEPDLFLAGFDEFNREVKNPALNPLGITFFGEIFKRNPAQINEWVQRVRTWSLSENSERVFWKALKYSELKEADKMMNSELANAKETRAKIIKETLGLQPNEFWGREPADTAQDLDALWGKFFATGGKGHLYAIVNSLKWVPVAKDDPAKVTDQSLVGIAAKWSLTANAKTSPDIREMLREKMKVIESPQIKSVLAKVIEDSQK